MSFDQSLDSFLSLAKHFYEQTEDFFLDMTVDLAHDYLFLTPHFPFFFVIQSIFICYIIRHYGQSIKPSESFLTGAFMAFLGRVFTAYFTIRKPPLLENVFYIPVFAVVWFLMNYSPFDLFYKIVGSCPIVFVMQLVYALIQVRETCHGVDIGLRGFPNSAVGAILLSFVLSSTESLVWMVHNIEVSEFSTVVILRNLAAAIFYFVSTNYPEIFPESLQIGKESVKIYILAFYLVIVIVNDILFGLRYRNGLDITFLSYISKICSYSGNN